MGTPTTPRWLIGGERSDGGQWVRCQCGARVALPSLDDWDAYVIGLRAFGRSHWECRATVLRASGASA